MKNMFSQLRHDLPASVVVFFVAVPLCLGIALGSGAPLFSGIIAGIVGGIVVGMASGSPLGVSGPAAGLAVIVLGSIAALGGSWETFLLAVVLMGIIQLIAGFLKLGFVAYYFPSSVIKGMLTGIGLLIILKQLPHAFGYDKDYEGDFSFAQLDGENTFSELGKMIDFINPGAVFISVICLAILLLWDLVLTKKHKIFGMLNGPLVAVITGIVLHYFFIQGILPFSLKPEQVVSLPVPSSLGDFFSQFTFPDFSQLTNPKVYSIAFVLAIVASLETLLCVEATDKLDPDKRVTPTNRELKAQGLGNIVSGLIGGLPLTQVIVRSSANITFGAKTKMSAILHGVYLFICAITIANLLNMIPLATLATILFIVGYKLAKPSLFKAMYKQGREHFIPFLATIIGILLTDLLTGIGIGMAFAIFYLLLNNYRNAYDMRDVSNSPHDQHIVLVEEVSFLNKGGILKKLNEIPENSKVLIDASRSKYIHQDVIEIIQDYIVHAKSMKNIQVEVKGIPTVPAA
ncbi:MAG: SulP family inorganic anion transporter [Saprospiraceae bacterium]|nr:SulP family inorganic anion transporter [Candidatus Opimibacter skivensis]